MSTARIFGHKWLPLQLARYFSRASIGAVTAFLALTLSGCGAYFFQNNSTSLVPDEIVGIAQDNRFFASGAKPLSGGEIFAFLTESTVVTRSINDPEQIQYGHFGMDGVLTLSVSPTRTLRGTWGIDGNSLCYQTTADPFCSMIVEVDALHQGKPTKLYYFARVEEFEPTVIIVSILPGFKIPSDRL